MNAAQERMFELLASRATEGLSATDSRDLDGLLERSSDVDPEGFDRAAAAVHLALLGPEKPMPEALKRRLVSEGIECLSAGDGVAAATARGRRANRPAAGGRGALGWWAAAAALALALAGWWPRLDTATLTTTEGDQAVAPAIASLVEDPATVRLAWTATEDATAAGASGEIVWNTRRQTGYMSFSGLAKNDPAEFQYQLWIFDRTRDESYPVDGGVFDMTTETGELVIPIDAKIRVGEPYLFAVTVEPPGGVVVSTRERIALVAQS